MSKKTPAPFYPIELPNVGSSGQTPASLAIDIHYMNLMLDERWDWERFVKLCTFLKMTPCEVASLVMLPHSTVPSYRERNRIPLPPSRARPVALILTLLEAHLMKGLTADVVANPFPNLAKP